MPSYEAVCHECGKYHTYIKSVANYLDTPECCGVKTEKVILNGPRVFVPMNICYESPIDGRPITSKQARIEDLKRSGCREWEGMASEKKAVQEAKKESDKVLEKQLDQRITESIQQLKPESRKVLGL